MGSKASCRLVLSLTVLCAAFSLGQRDQVEHALSLVSPVFSPAGPQFAIEDFDGDRKPDLAEVKVEHSDSHSTSYSINFHFTSGVNRSFGIDAPFGGLQIAVRDVNGDNYLDLIVSTAFRHEPVAVLLNDGHGNFSRVEPASFPSVIGESDTNLHAASNRSVDAVGVPPQSRSGLFLQAEALANFRRRAGPISIANPGFTPSSYLALHPGRAPPAEVSHS